MRSSYIAGAAALALLASCAATTYRQAEPSEAERVTNIGVMVGLRQLDEDDWDPVDEQVAFGLEIDTYVPGAPIGFELGGSYSKDDDSAFDPLVGNFDAEAKFWEIYGGVRKTWAVADGRLHPYVGGGLSFINADAKVSVSGFGSASDDDSSVGGYVHGGATYDVTDSIYLGVDLRGLLGTDLEIAGASGDADYLQVALVLGYSL